MEEVNFIKSQRFFFNHPQHIPGTLNSKWFLRSFASIKVAAGEKNWGLGASDGVGWWSGKRDNWHYSEILIDTDVTDVSLYIHIILNHGLVLIYHVCQKEYFKDTVSANFVDTCELKLGPPKNKRLTFVPAYHIHRNWTCCLFYGSPTNDQWGYGAPVKIHG